ncbi:MAG: hypothetical protein INH43_02155 [Acidobacteriaceae bacterium]|nr:hypothetical protein [Acidobacteriaceae bacterium]
MRVRAVSCLLVGILAGGGTGRGWAQECRLTPLTPIVPAAQVAEGEPGLESQTFLTAVSAVSPGNELHFVDSVNRIRRLDGAGRLRTVAGSGVRGLEVVEGPARGAALPSIGQILFSPAGVLHFVTGGRVWKVEGERIVAVAGTGRPGFNGEAVGAAEVNLGGIVSATFGGDGRLLLVDGFNRVRRLDGDGVVRTIAGSTRVAGANGLTGDEGPAVQAALSNPRQVVALRDGRIWIRDLGGRHLREISRAGVIDTIQTNFDTGVSILVMADGRPAGVTANRLLPIRDNGQLETGAAPYPAFTGTPRAIGPDGALYFEGSARPEQRNPMVRSRGGQTAVVASAPAIVEVDGQAPPFGIWRNGALLYASSLGDKAGILEARPGQGARFVVGGGRDIGDADGKSATSLTIFGIQTFSVDGAGRILVADAYRKRILAVETDGRVNELKGADGSPIVFGPLGTFSSLQRIAGDQAGNVYWYTSGATPAGGVFTADVSIWVRADRTVRTVRVVGLAALLRLADGSVGVMAGNSATFRSVYPLTLTGLGPALPGMALLPLQSVSSVQGENYFTAAARLFRGVTGRLEMLDVSFLPSGTVFSPDFVVSTGGEALVHLASDGGFYRLEGAGACGWLPQPRVASEGVRNAASFGNPNVISPRQLVTIFGSGLGPAGGQGMVLDGSLRATGQPAPYPALQLGGFSGAIPVATLTGTTLPVVYSDDRQVTVQAPVTAPASNEYFLYFGWQGLTLLHDQTVRVTAVTPGVFAEGDEAAALNEDGGRNGAGRGAREGSVLQVFATGLGAVTGTLALGDFAPAQALLPVAGTVSAEMGGVAAEVVFAGAAPGQIGGVYQVNVMVPSGLAAGGHPLVVRVGGQAAPAVKVWVR